MGYTDSPDGEACFEKMLICGKNAGLIGVIASTYDLLMISKPQGYVPAMGCYIRGTVPLAAAGISFAAVSCMSTKLRHKDDHYNYLFGGVAAGSMIGVAKKSFKIGVPTAFFLGLAAVLYKDSLMAGWRILPNADIHQMGTFDTIKNDYTRVGK